MTPDPQPGRTRTAGRFRWRLAPANKAARNPQQQAQPEEQT